MAPGRTERADDAAAERATRADSLALMERLRSGDAAAFDRLYALYRARVHAFLLRLSGSSQLARDLSQDLWLRFAVNARRLAPGTEPGAWLFTVARNLFISHRRWALLDRARLAQLVFMAREPEPRSPATAALESEAHARLERAVAALPLQQREVLLLIAIEGFELAQVARMLDIREDAVRKRLSRARAALRHALGESP